MSVFLGPSILAVLPSQQWHCDAMCETNLGQLQIHKELHIGCDSRNPILGGMDQTRPHFLILFDSSRHTCSKTDGIRGASIWAAIVSGKWWEEAHREVGDDEKVGFDPAFLKDHLPVFIWSNGAGGRMIFKRAARCGMCKNSAKTAMWPRFFGMLFFVPKIPWMSISFTSFTCPASRVLAWFTSAAMWRSRRRHSDVFVLVLASGSDGTQAECSCSGAPFWYGGRSWGWKETKHWKMSSLGPSMSF